MQHTLSGSLVIGAALLSACGGGSDGGGNNTSTSPPPPVANASPGGIWLGRDPLTGSDILGLVAEDGRAQFISFDAASYPVQYWGTLRTSGNSILSSTFQVADDDTYYGSAAVNGSVAERQSLSLTVSFTPASGCAPSVCGPARTQALTLNFNSVYNRGGTLSRTAGNWQDVVTGQIYNVNASGVVFQQDALTGCVINGQISTINTNYNAYSASYSYNSCRFPYTYLNGTQATGLLTVDDTVSPNRIYLAAQYREGGTTYAIYGEGIKR
jgi:hypothetical protein